MKKIIFLILIFFESFTPGSSQTISSRKYKDIDGTKVLKILDSLAIVDYSESNKKSIVFLSLGVIPSGRILVFDSGRINAYSFVVKSDEFKGRSIVFYEVKENINVEKIKKIIANKPSIVKDAILVPDSTKYWDASHDFDMYYAYSESSHQTKTFFTYNQYLNSQRKGFQELVSLVFNSSSFKINKNRELFVIRY